MEEKLWNEIRIRKIKTEKSTCILVGFPVIISSCVEGTGKKGGHLHTFNPILITCEAQFFLQDVVDI